MAAPDESVTKPTTRPVLVWQRAKLDRDRQARAAAIRNRHVRLSEKGIDAGWGVMAIRASWVYKLPEIAEGVRKGENVLAHKVFRRGRGG
jgi:hypothetical protein